MKLLDAGCGYGYCLRTYGPFIMPNGRLYGVDIHRNLLKNAKKYSDKEGLRNVSYFSVGDIYKLPFGKNTFDISMAQIVLSHLKEHEQALIELIRVTKRGGCIAVFDNAVGEGSASAGWDNIFKPTIKVLQG